MHQKYDIAAFVWPAYTGDELRTRIFWPEGIGEWEIVKNMKPKYPGHLWPRKPLWGYVNEADPSVMEMEINEATSHGVNVFIYDWYWYDNRPFLENCLNDGFLKAANHDLM
ncbi:MAG: glycoside hydrolase family 99-like domain-containing protein, partial [Firmicutes bacterium]|nr:glycoside hydrolase family 99-like domain-containing protein [Bacillota bacterium]